MRVTCDHCSQVLAIPDEKVPNRAFSLTCPKCKGSVRVDPKPVVPADPTPTPDTPASATKIASTTADANTAAEGGSGRSGFAALHALRPAEQALLDRLSPLVYLVGLTNANERARVAAGLERLGLTGLEDYPNLTEAIQALATAPPGLMLIRQDGVPTPPDTGLAPLGQLASPLRRSLFVALLANGVHALDGQLAFLLQVDCVLDAETLHRFPADLRRALLVRQQRYRHWHLDEDG